MFECEICEEQYETEQALWGHIGGKHWSRQKRKPQHGTPAGYLRHNREKSEVCTPCKKAWRIYYQKRRTGGPNILYLRKIREQRHRK